MGIVSSSSRGGRGIPRAEDEHVELLRLQRDACEMHAKLVGVVAVGVVSNELLLMHRAGIEVGPNSGQLCMVCVDHPM